MTSTDYQIWLAEWFSRRNPHIVVAIEDNFFNAGVIDSLGTIELIEEIEQNFAIRFSQEDFQDRRFASIAGLAELLMEKTGL